MINLDVLVFSPSLTPLGLINQLKSAVWESRINDYDGFEMWSPLTEETAALLKRGNYVYIDENHVGVIETILETLDQTGKVLDISGRSIECLLDRRVVTKSPSGSNQVSSVLRQLVTYNIISPSITARKINNLILETPFSDFGSSITYDSSEKNLWDSLNLLCQKHGVVQKIRLDYGNQKLEYCLRQTENKSIESGAALPVMLSTEFSDILSSKYTCDENNWYNVIFVEGLNRSTIVDPYNASQLNRRELYIDATDLTGYEEWEIEETIITEFNTYTSTRNYAEIRTTRAVIDTDKVALGSTDYQQATTIEMGYEIDEDSSGYTEGDTEEILIEGGNVVRQFTNVQKKSTTTTSYTTDITTIQTRTNTVTGEVIDLQDTVTVNGKQGTEGTVKNTYSEQVRITDEKYEAQLQERGTSELIKRALVEGFEFTLNSTNPSSFVFGTDYLLGDRITVKDTELGIQVSTDVTEAKETWDNTGYGLVLSLGTTAPTITQLIRRKK